MFENMKPKNLKSLALYEEQESKLRIELENLAETCSTCVDEIDQGVLRPEERLNDLMDSFGQVLDPVDSILDLLDDSEPGDEVELSDLFGAEA